ncbi:MAG: hypothetical protein IPJ88_08965 [Myxococcales bacterium]|nr:MAG: hypothetical protein IPJ88_08965 [Myxococcales bacterium]
MAFGLWGCGRLGHDSEQKEILDPGGTDSGNDAVSFLDTAGDGISDAVEVTEDFDADGLSPLSQHRRRWRFDW